MEATVTSCLRRGPGNRISDNQPIAATVKSSDNCLFTQRAKGLGNELTENQTTASSDRKPKPSLPLYTEGQEQTMTQLAIGSDCKRMP